MEWKRLLSGKMTILLLAFLLGLNLWLFVREQQVRYSGPCESFHCSLEDIFREYRDVLKEYQGRTKEELLAELEQEFQEVLAYEDWTIREYVKSEMLLPQLRYQTGYDSYLEQVQQNAKKMGTISIFNEKDSFSFRNLQKTAGDFQRLQGTELTLGNYRWVEAAVQFRFTDYLIIIFLLFLCERMLQERKKGLWEVVRLCGGGRGRLAVKRLGILLAASVGAVLLFHGSVYFVSGWIYGADGWNAAVQSSELFFKLPIEGSFGALILQMTLWKIVAVFGLAALIWGICFVFTQIGPAIAVGGLLLAAEYMMYSLIPVQSGLNVFKYINLFSGLEMGSLYTGYQNLNLFGWPLNARRLFDGVILFVAAAGGAAAVFLQLWKYPEHRKGIWDKITDAAWKGADWALVRIPGFLKEWYKVLVAQRGWIIVILFAVLVGQQVSEGKIYFGAVDAVKNRLYRETQGPADGEKVLAVLDAEEEEVQAGLEEFQKKKALYEAGKLSEVEMSFAGMEYEALMSRQQAVDAVREDREKQLGLLSRGITGWMVNPVGYQRLLSGKADSGNRTAALLCILMTAVILSGSFAFERQTGVKMLLGSCGRGRGRLFWRKQGMALVICFAAVIACFGVKYWNIAVRYELTGLQAPVQSLWGLGLDQVKGRMSIGWFLILLTGLRILMLFVMVQLVFLISMVFSKVRSAQIAGLAVAVLPSVLWILGVEWAKYAAFAWPVSAMEILSAGGFHGPAAFGPFLLWGAVGILLILWERAKVEGREISSAFGKITAAVSAKTGRDRKND